MPDMNDAHLDNEQKYGFHKPDAYTRPLHEELRTEFRRFANLLDSILPEGDAKTQAGIRLKETSMWANFSVAEMGPLE